MGKDVSDIVLQSGENKKVLESVHSDVMGSIETNSRGG